MITFLRERIFRRFAKRVIDIVRFTVSLGRVIGFRSILSPGKVLEWISGLGVALRLFRKVRLE